MNILRIRQPDNIHINMQKIDPSLLNEHVGQVEPVCRLKQNFIRESKNRMDEVQFL
ncbi:24576_t:CDS:2 [Gigaspora rosea]|nr:24576_t:CDS:2 [Gigaspora rosea]